MVIVSVLLEYESGERQTYQLVDKIDEVSLESNPIRILADREDTIADCIWRALALESTSFICNGKLFKIIKVTAGYNINFKKVNKYYRRKVDFTAFPEIQCVYVYQHSSICQTCLHNGRKDNSEQIIAKVKTIMNRNREVEINISYCRTCKEYFANYDLIKRYQKQYGTLLFECEYCNLEEWDDDCWFEYKQNSILSRYNYIAQQDKQSTNERRAILAYLLDSNTVSKTEIIHILNNLIRFRGDRCYKACPIWESDLKFVINYKSDSEKHVENVKLTPLK